MAFVDNRDGAPEPENGKKETLLWVFSMEVDALYPEDLREMGNWW